MYKEIFRRDPQPNCIRMPYSAVSICAVVSREERGNLLDSDAL